MMTTTFKGVPKPLYVYLQRPDTGEWVTVGRLLRPATTSKTGYFQYAPSYLDAGLTWSLDPVNLPVLKGYTYPANRYGGLHDVLRDAAPDAWGRALIQREHGLSDFAPHVEYLVRASNADRWGALAVGASRSPAVAQLSSPKLDDLNALVEELSAMQANRPPKHPKLRRRLMSTPSMGGARPKASIQDADRHWLVKPILPSDAYNLPLLEHAVRQWANAAGLRFAESVFTPAGDASALHVYRSLRFDRKGSQRIMTVSAASLLQTEYPAGGNNNLAWSYPSLANTLIRIGAPIEDGKELFGRMVFNAVIGNDDDHPRNHAARYLHEEGRWRLAPAYDVVPNTDFTPRYLAMQLSTGDREISRQAALKDARAFGFGSHAEAAEYLDALLMRISDGFEAIRDMLDDSLRSMMAERLGDGLSRIAGAL